MTEPGRRPRLRVGLVVSTPQRRGAEVFADGLAERLRERDWSVEVASIDRSDAANVLEEITPLGDGRRSVAMWRNLVRLARRCDVLVASGGTTLLPVAAIARITATPYVYRNIGDPSAWATSTARTFASGSRCEAPLASSHCMAVPATTSSVDTASTPDASPSPPTLLRATSSPRRPKPNVARHERYSVSVSTNRSSSTSAHCRRRRTRSW